jgi:hypothetical protein
MGLAFPLDPSPLQLMCYIHTSVLTMLNKKLATHTSKALSGITFGHGIWNQRERFVTKLWNIIQEKVNLLDIDYKKV